MNAGLLSFNAAGRVRATAAAPSVNFPLQFNGGTPMIGRFLAYVVSVPTVYLGGIGYANDGRLCVSLGGVPVTAAGGVPVDAQGRICVNQAAGGVISFFLGGLPFGPAGRLRIAPAEVP